MLDSSSYFLKVLFNSVGQILGGAKDDVSRIAKGGVIGSLAGKYLGTNLTGAEREANSFTTAEREAAQQWSEDMYNKYQSPQAQMNSQIVGMKENGINPALMYGGSPVSAGSMPSASGGSSVSPSAGNLLSSLVALLRTKNDFIIAKERNEIEDRRVKAIEELNPSRIESNYASAWRNITAGNLNDIDAKSRSDMNDARIAVAYSQVDLATNRARLAQVGINESVARAGLLVLQAVNQVIANNYADKYWQAELSYKAAVTEESWDKANYYLKIIDNLTTEALNTAYNTDLIGRYIDEKDIDIQLKGFKLDHQNVDWLFDKGVQTMNIITNGVSAGASLGRTVNYGRSVTAGINRGAGSLSNRPIYTHDSLSNFDYLD